MAGLIFPVCRDCGLRLQAGRCPMAEPGERFCGLGPSFADAYKAQRMLDWIFSDDDEPFDHFDTDPAPINYSTIFCAALFGVWMLTLILK